MTLDEVKRIIEEEDLKLYNLDANQPFEEDEVVIRLRNDEWVVFATSERASIVPGSEVTFKTESEALENFLGRLRAGNRVLNYHPAFLDKG
jgi:hypothetical protein